MEAERAGREEDQGERRAPMQPPTRGGSFRPRPREGIRCQGALAVPSPGEKEGAHGVHYVGERGDMKIKTIYFFKEFTSYLCS